jgi:hypothetical protein
MFKAHYLLQLFHTKKEVSKYLIIAVEKKLLPPYWNGKLEQHSLMVLTDVHQNGPRQILVTLKCFTSYPHTYACDCTFQSSSYT